MINTSSKNKSLRLRAAVWLAVFVLLLGSVVFLAARPISYNMDYYGETNDEYGFFFASRRYDPDDFVVIDNSNYDLPLVNFYYYKDGYVFDMRAATDEQFAQEVEKINSRWEDALKVDFYSSRINAYRISFFRPDGVETVYTCKGAVVLTAAAAAAALVAAGLSCSCAVRYRKAKREEQAAEE